MKKSFFPIIILALAVILANCVRITVDPVSQGADIGSSNYAIRFQNKGINLSAAAGLLMMELIEKQKAPATLTMGTTKTGVGADAVVFRLTFFIPITVSSGGITVLMFDSAATTWNPVIVAQTVTPLISQYIEILLTLPAKIDLNRKYCIKFASALVRDAAGNGLNADGDAFSAEGPEDNYYFYFMTTGSSTFNQILEDNISPVIGSLYYKDTTAAHSLVKAGTADSLVKIFENSFYVNIYDFTHSAKTDKDTVTIMTTANTTKDLVLIREEGTHKAFTNFTVESSAIDTSGAGSIKDPIRAHGIKIKLSAVPDAGTYLLLISNEITDAAGNSVDNSKPGYIQFKFAVGGALTKPSIAKSFDNGTHWIIYFNEKIDQSTLNTTTVFMPSGKKITMDINTGAKWDNLYSQTTILIVYPVTGTTSSLTIQLSEIKLEGTNSYGTGSQTL